MTEEAVVGGTNVPEQHERATSVTDTPGVPPPVPGAPDPEQPVVAPSQPPTPPPGPPQYPSAPDVYPVPPGTGMHHHGSSGVRQRSAWHRGLVAVGSVVWAVLPIATIGLAAPFTVGYAAHRLRSRALVICASVYGATVVTAFVLVGSTASDSDWKVNAGMWLALATGTAATIQSFIVRDQVVHGPTAGDDVIGGARETLRRRDASRRIVAQNPLLARELMIGRPDLERRYDDGGLVDVNHVPVEVLATLPGIDRATAELIADVRFGIGGFASVDDLSVTLHLAPQVLDASAPRMVFLR